MNISEVKLRIVNTLNSLIDTYFRTDILNERFINSTLKIIVKQNISKVKDFQSTIVFTLSFAFS